MGFMQGFAGGRGVVDFVSLPINFSDTTYASGRSVYTTTIGYTLLCLFSCNAKLQGLVVDARRGNSPALVSFGGVAVSLSCSATIRTALSAHPAPPGRQCSGYVCRSAVRRARNNLIWEAPAIIWPSQSGVCTEPFSPATRNPVLILVAPCRALQGLKPRHRHLLSALSPIQTSSYFTSKITVDSALTTYTRLIRRCNRSRI